MEVKYGIALLYCISCNCISVTELKYICDFQTPKKAGSDLSITCITFVEELDNLIAGCENGFICK